MLFFNPTTMGFYDDEIHLKNNIPKEAVEVSKKEYSILMEQQAITPGAMISVGADGKPIITYPDTKLKEILEEVLWVEVELLRVRDELEKVQDADQTSIGTVTDWRNYRKTLRVWPEHVEFPKPEFRPKAPDAE